MSIIGIDIGGTKCAVILGNASIDGRLNIISKKTVLTKDFPDPYRMITRLQQMIDDLLVSSETEITPVSSIGISCGGPLDSKTGIIYSPPNLPGWDEIHIAELFSQKYGIPVSLQNDANACALAEWLLGAGRGTSNMVFLTFGTGMGGGLILNGRLYSGTNDLGGEIGHIRLAKTGPVGFGKAGSFEGFCSGGGIAQLAKSIVLGKLKENQIVGFCPSAEMAGEIDAKTVAEAARQGDPVALQILNESAEYLGHGLAILIDILNPECIVIGSIYARNETFFKPVVEEVLRREAIPSAFKVCKIKPSELGESIGDFASLCVAFYKEKF